MLKDILDQLAINNGWDDWNDVVFNAQRRTIADLLDEAIDILN